MVKYGEMGDDWSSSELPIYLVCLCLGLGVVAPVVGILLKPVLPYSVLVAVAAVTVGYTVLVIWRGTFVVGAVVALVITSTFALNFPLTAPYVPLFDEWFRQNVTGFVAPSLWAFQLPLAVLTVVGIKNGWYHWERYKRTELALGGVVGWAAVSAVFGQPIRPIVAALFVVYLLQVWLAFVSIGRAIDESYVTTGDTIRLVVAAGVLHSAVAAVQFLNAGPLGLTRLGGGAAYTTAFLPLFGGLELEMGLFVAGFTGMAYTYAALTVLVVPVLAAAALVTENQARKLGFGVLAIAMIFLNRATTSDTARGAMLVAVSAFSAIVLMNKRRAFVTTQAKLRYLAFTVVGIGVTLSKSTLSGQTHTDETTGDNPPSDVPSNGGTGSGSSPGGDSIAVVEPDTYLPDWVLANPFFSVNTLGIRLKQYVGATDIMFQNPLFGVGGVNFRYTAAKYGIDPPMAVHNVYLMLGAGIGLPGVLFYLLALLLVCYRGWIALRRKVADSLIYGGVLAGVLGVSAFGMLDHLVLDRFTVSLPLWIIAAALIRTGTDSQSPVHRSA